MAKRLDRGASIIFRAKQSPRVADAILAQSLWNRLFKAWARDVGFDSIDFILVVQSKQPGNAFAALDFFCLYPSEYLGLCEFFARLWTRG